MAEVAKLADLIRAAVINPKTNAHTMQPCDAMKIAEVLAANGYGKLEDAWSEGAHFGGLYDHVFANDNPYRRPE